MFAAWITSSLAGWWKQLRPKEHFRSGHLQDMAADGLYWMTVHEYSSPSFIPQPSAPHPLTKEVMPITIGHEFSGEVLEVGSKAEK